VPVAVVVAECAARAPAVFGDPGCPRDVGKRSAAGIAPQHVGSERGDVDVLEAVVVVVGDADARPPSAAVESRRGRRVGEAARAVVAVQRHHRIAAPLELLARRAVDDHHVEIVVVVVVEEGRAVPVGVDDEILVRTARHVEEVEPGLRGDVHEADRGALGAGHCQVDREENDRDVGAFHEAISLRSA
jgi:hypothetical protein